jgi:type I restriction enzyme R subunit
MAVFVGVGPAPIPPDALPFCPVGTLHYTEEEERSLSEIIQAFSERHGTNFTREDFLRFEQVNQEIMDDDMMEMMRNNPTDVVYSAFSQTSFQGMVRIFHKDNVMKSVVMTDHDAREQATRHFFKRVQRQARG